MLLVDDLLSVARVWLHREKVEHEAAGQFERLAVDLAAAGAPGQLVDLAGRAAADEVEHVVLCRRVVDHLAPGLAPLMPAASSAALGPSLPVERRALYGSVALSCVTETFSTALLLEMRRLAADELVGATIQRILRDEIAHSRLGWAHLAWAARRGEVGWLAAHLPGMVRESLGGELPPVAADAAVDGAASHPGDRFGVLSAARIRGVAALALEQVIVPGLARYGIDAGERVGRLAGS